MSDIATLKAEPRERVGKGSARAARREGRVPAVIYGNKQEPISITVAHNELMRLINRGGFLSSALDIEIKGKKERVLPRDVQLHPVTDWPIHVDFLRLSRDATVNIFVPVHVVNQEASPGIKRGGVLNLVRHEVELTCPADAIPEHIVIDVTGLEVGDSVHISAVKLPEGVTPVIQDRDFTIATIQAPSGLKSEEAEEAAAEGEDKE
ncbi:MAG TPA: 50S ribosomal protein L25/general stress protein Ctc [Sphingomonadales bacterium]